MEPGYLYVRTSLSSETLPLAGWPAYISRTVAEGPQDAEEIPVTMLYSKLKIVGKSTVLEVTPDYSEARMIGTYCAPLCPGHFGFVRLW